MLGVMQTGQRENLAALLRKKPPHVLAPLLLKPLLQHPDVASTLCQPLAPSLTTDLQKLAFSELTPTVLTPQSHANTFMKLSEDTNFLGELAQPCLLGSIQAYFPGRMDKTLLGGKSPWGSTKQSKDRERAWSPHLSQFWSCRSLLPLIWFGPFSEERLLPAESLHASSHRASKEDLVAC